MGAHGSPPRTWGRLRHRTREQSIQPFTPTHVGKTIRPPLWPAWPAVHPHARGEDALTAPVQARAPGSPPRTWGRPGTSVTADSQWRFTPTHVGKTSPSERFTASDTVHPHARGEDF